MLLVAQTDRPNARCMRRQEQAAEEQLRAEHGVEHEHREDHGEPDPVPGLEVLPPPELQQLTPREAEILLLIAFVTEPTIKSHAAHILMKLQLRDRVQVVVYAHEHGRV